jgi:glucan phosphoethanolaminetransferase (alkaline phosphatase superfamily)
MRGDVLEINNSQANNTPFLASHRDELTNFGVAVSGANCSFLSRSMLKFGLRPDHFPELNLGLTSLKRPIGPPIWKYARYAGYRMVMIDGCPEAEIYKDPEISSKWYFSETDAPTFMRDGLIANRLLQLLKEDAPSFIYVNKFGTHSPYGRAFSRDSDGAKPVSPQDDEKPVLGQDGDGTALLRAYNHALAWSVDEFFKKLLNQFDDQSVLLIYPSDHGQSLGDGGQKITHCSTTNTQVGEGLVPLLVLTGIHGPAARLRKSAMDAYGHASHFEIFPTLLLAMGSGSASNTDQVCLTFRQIDGADF